MLSLLLFYKALSKSLTCLYNLRSNFVNQDLGWFINEQISILRPIKKYTVYIYIYISILREIKRNYVHRLPRFTSNFDRKTFSTCKKWIFPVNQKYFWLYQEIMLLLNLKWNKHFCEAVKFLIWKKSKSTDKTLLWIKSLTII